MFAFRMKMWHAPTRLGLRKPVAS